MLKTSFISRIPAILAACLAVATIPAMAQVAPIDPDRGIDADLVPVAAAAQPVADSPSDAAAAAAVAGGAADAAQVDGAQNAPPAAAAVPASVGPPSQTYRKDDLIGAAEGVFGKGARGLADLIEDLLKKQGEPNAYISGREAGGALVVGVRYGSGTLYHKIEGELPAYWTGPSIGLDAGANAANTFVLVYNLYDSADLYKKRFAAGEGQAYLIGGFHVSYLRRGDVVLIPVRAGAGLRLGINAGYMKFSRKQKWLPL